MRRATAFVSAAVHGVAERRQRIREPRGLRRCHIVVSANASSNGHLDINESIVDFTMTALVVPEPSTLVLTALALVGLLAPGRRRRV